MNLKNLTAPSRQFLNLLGGLKTTAVVQQLYETVVMIDKWSGEAYRLSSVLLPSALCISFS